MPPQSAPSSFSSSIHLSFIFLFLSLGHISPTLAQNSSQAGHTTHVSLSYSRADYIFSPSILTLSCVPDNEEASFWRILDNATEQVVVCLYSLDCSVSLSPSLPTSLPPSLLPYLSLPLSLPPYLPPSFPTSPSLSTSFPTSPVVTKKEPIFPHDNCMNSRDV